MKNINLYSIISSIMFPLIISSSALAEEGDSAAVIASESTFVFRVYVQIKAEDKQVNFSSSVDKVVYEGESSTLSWSVKKTVDDLAILFNGNQISSSETGSYTFTPVDGEKIVIGLFDVKKSAVIEQHEHYVTVVKKASWPDANYVIVPHGDSAVFSWDISSSDYNSASIKVSNDSNLNQVLSPVLSGSQSISIVGETTMTIDAVLKSGKSISQSKTVYPLTVSIPSEVTTLPTYTIDTHYGYASGNVNVYVNGELKSQKGNGSAELSSADLIVGANEIKVVPVAGTGISAKSWVGSIKKLVVLGDTFSSDFDMVPSGSDINISWDMPSDYTESKIENWSTANAAKNIISNSLTGTHTANSLAGFNYFSLSAKSTGGTAVSKQLSVEGYDVSSLDYLSEDDGLTVTFSSQDGLADIYVNGVKVKSQTQNGTFTLSESSFVLGENTIEITPISLSEKKIKSFSKKVVKYPSLASMLTTNYKTAQPGMEIIATWDVPDTFTNVKVEFWASDNTTKRSTISTSNKGQFTALKSGLYDYFNISATNPSGETQSEKITINYVDLYAFYTIYIPGVDTNKVIYQSSIPGDIYVNGVRAFAMDVGASDTNSFTAGDDLFNVGDNLVEIIPTGAYATSEHAIAKNVITKLPGFSIDSDTRLARKGDSINLSWEFPSEYSSVSVSFKAENKTSVISTQNKGAYSFPIPASGMTYGIYYVTYTAKTPQGRSFTKSFSIDTYDPYFPPVAYKDKTTDVTFHSRSSATYSIYVNGVLVNDDKIAETGYNNKTISNSEMHLGENDIEIRAKLATGYEAKPYFTKTLLIEAPVVDLSYGMLPSGEDITYSWSFPEEFESVTVKRYRWDNEDPDVLLSTSKKGSFTMIKGSGYDVFSISAEGGTKMGGGYFDYSAYSYGFSVNAPAEVSGTADFNIEYLSKRSNAELLINGEVAGYLFDGNNSISIDLLSIGDNSVEVRSVDGVDGYPSKSWKGVIKRN